MITFLLRKIKRYFRLGTIVSIFLLGACWIFYSITLTKINDVRGRVAMKNQVSVSTQQQSVQQTMSINTERDVIMDQRKTDLMKKCNKHASHIRPYREHMIYNRNKQFLYCKATKAGSTFWGRLLLQVDRHKVESPYKIKPQIGPINTIPTKQEWGKFGEILKSSTKFIIARNPLGRLFSGYIDKVYSPNPYYWKGLGTYIIQIIRKTSQRSCGHDVTFPEFLQYAINAETSSKHLDVHVTSLWKTCSPCHVKYDMIGKMETFKDDTNYILDKLNLGHYKAVLRNVSSEAVNDALYDTAQAYLDMRTEAVKCISEEHIAERIWTKLKTRGFIAADLPVPMELLHSKAETEVFKIFKDAYSKSVVKVGRDGLKRQQKAIFSETLRKLPNQILTQIANVYHMDFEMFGYDPKFDDILNGSNTSDFSVSNNFFGQ